MKVLQLLVDGEPGQVGEGGRGMAAGSGQLHDHVLAT
jgi:hypothetical protein